jgi:hypothetical protein
VAFRPSVGKTSALSSEQGQWGKIRPINIRNGVFVNVKNEIVKIIFSHTGLLGELGKSVE